MDVEDQADRGDLHPGRPRRPDPRCRGRAHPERGGSPQSGGPRAGCRGGTNPHRGHPGLYAPGFEDLRAELIEEGVSVEEASLRINTALRTRQKDRRGGLHRGTPEP
jgi:hypothetical protein